MAGRLSRQVGAWPGWAPQARLFSAAVLRRPVSAGPGRCSFRSAGFIPRSVRTGPAAPARPSQDTRLRRRQFGQLPCDGAM
ncbi:hypothetical protein AV530_010326 [Patagioenas fasciata monilis]|uniref:Uncharacterized protein n=1 Tax=Patagioenas fasciata monilis TaxID=372326 RepID=A0A1V4KEE4_PATFA|nr:hypothetical protein AV530_010326 [Patagioenas fasciata monilis]